MFRQLASLTTRGRCLLAAGLAAALCAVLVNERDLLRVAAFAVTLPLLASVIVGYTQLRLRADRELVPARITAGADCQVHLRVRGTGALSSWLVLEDGVPQALGGPHLTVVARLPVTLSYPLRAPERGVHSLGPLSARIADPFGLAECSRPLAGPSRLVVIPLVVPLRGSPAGGGQGGGEADAGRVGVGPSHDAVVVRTYRHGDDLRKVHWRTTARRDELMVRVEQWRERGGATVLLDHRRSAHRGQGPTSSLEYAVSLAASVYVHLRQRARLRGCRPHAGAPETPGRGAGGRHRDAATATPVPSAAPHPSDATPYPNDTAEGRWCRDRRRYQDRAWRCRAAGARRAGGAHPAGSARGPPSMAAAPDQRWRLPSGPRRVGGGVGGVRGPRGDPPCWRDRAGERATVGPRA